MPTPMSDTTMSDLAVAFAKLHEARQIMDGARDAAAFQERQADFLSKLLDAKSALLAAQEERSTLLERIRDLERQLDHLKTREAKKQRYELVSLAPNVVAYALKEAMRGNEPSHYLCANCFASDRDSFLQMHAGMGVNIFTCSYCNSQLKVPTSSAQSARYALPQGRRGGGPDSWMGA